MRRRVCYLLHPSLVRNPYLDEAISEIEELIKTDAEWYEWNLVSIPCDLNNSFKVGDLYGRIREENGPLVVIEKVQRKPLDEIRKKVWYLTIVQTTESYDPVDIFEVIQDARKKFESGEPFLPRKFVLAILIARKLEKGNFWGGKDKGYMWVDDIRKGRGIPPDADRAAISQVVSDLFLGDFLIRKKSKRYHKYALNPNFRSQISALTTDGTVMDDRLYKLLMKDKQLMSARDISWKP